MAILERAGEEFLRIVQGNPATQAGAIMLEYIPSAQYGNGWFTPSNIMHRLSVLGNNLSSESLRKWTSSYNFPVLTAKKNIGVILAGNIPFSGADDLFAVLITGHRFTGKTSSDDPRLFRMMVEVFHELAPELKEEIVLQDAIMKNMDAVIATGSNNSGRYFEHYFSKYPHIIRKNRNGVAVLNGHESNEELFRLGEDVFRYFGLGCRNVTKLFVPSGYSFDRFFENIVSYGDELMMAKKYMNNYEYHKTVYLLNNVKLLDNHFLILKEDEGISSPPGVLFYEFYNDPSELKNKLESEQDRIQCVVSNAFQWDNTVPIGTAQNAGLADYADNTDSVKFLLGL
ncbi:MAG: acyl-CoA reductase [Bacteroidia bacterium]